jgi:hypothetical protein
METNALRQELMKLSKHYYYLCEENKFVKSKIW